MPRYQWSLSEIESLARNGDVTAEGMLQASEDAIRASEPGIQAWAHLDLAGARHRARSLPLPGRPSAVSPLRGVPYGAKDIFDTADMPTEWGSATQRGRCVSTNCGLVARLEQMGAVLLGKTHTTAYAFFDPGPTRNPHDPAHTPGGSSSGSAAAVAAGMVPFAIGSQTQGSVLRPASFCGIAGFKPSFGKLPLDGVMPFAPTLDHAGVFAADAKDIRIVWKALGFEVASVPAPAITVLDWPPGDRVEPSMALAFRSAVQTLSSRGLRMRQAPRPRFFDSLPRIVHTIMAWEAAHEHWERYRTFGAAVGTRLANLLAHGHAIDMDEYRVAVDQLHATRRTFAKWSREHRVIATPAAPGPPPRGLGSTGDPRCNAPFTALGVPAISIPMPVPEGELPRGLQLVAPSGEEAALLATAVDCEALLRDES